jgi:hypothetical protein
MIEIIDDKIFNGLISLLFLNPSQNLPKTMLNYSFSSLSQLTDLHLEFNPHLKNINDNHIFAGLNSVKIIVSDFESVIQLKDSFKIDFTREINGIKFYKSINIKSVSNNFTYNREDCFKILYMLKCNLHLNLMDDKDFSKFELECLGFGLEWIENLVLF